MSKIRVYYSCDFENDSEIAQQIMDLDIVHCDKPISKSEWEKIKLGGTATIKKWISDRMIFCSCLIVLIGENTTKKPIINYEIKKAWTDNLGILGICVGNVKKQHRDNSTNKTNPFIQFSFDGINFSDIVKCYEPDKEDPYSDIKNNLEKWIKEAIEIRMKYMFEYAQIK
ncbi:MAG: TIR domain-containing protein [Bacteroidota bacterium]